MLFEGAGSVGRMKGKNYLSAQFARLTSRRGMGRAAIAVVHSMLVSVYYVLSRTSRTPTSAPTEVFSRVTEVRGRNG